MLWDSIYEFYVTKIFGGYYLHNYYSAFFGRSYNGANNLYNHVVSISVFGVDISIGNYFSLVATLITIIIIFILCCLFIKKIISLMGKLFSGGTL